MKRLIVILFLCIALPSVVCAGSRENQMRADVKKLVDAAMGHEWLWPWQASMKEVHKVAAYGKAVAPMLLELLCDKPEEDFNCVDLQVQQHTALALCEIYNVQPMGGHIYMNRAGVADNNKVKAFLNENDYQIKIKHCEKIQG